MTSERAINIAEKKLKMKFTGFGYEYDGDYFLEMSPEGYNPKKDGRILDSCYKVDSSTGKVSVYSPMLDGIQDITKMHYFE